MMSIVYQVKLNDLQHLKAHIRDAVAMVTPNMLQATRNEVEYHLDIPRNVPASSPLADRFTHVLESGGKLIMIWAGLEQHWSWPGQLTES
jgi:hypothetical protein